MTTDHHDPNTALTETFGPVTSTLALPRFGGEGFPGGELSDLGDEEWPAQRPKTGIRLRMPTAILLGLLLAAGGVWGGSVLQKHEGAGAATTGTAAARAGFARGAGGGAGFGGSGTATTGTVTDIIGSALYVTDSSGQLIKVTLSPSATVTRNATSSLAGLKPGDTVTVEGTTPTNGAMTASSVAATAKGVTPTGGFGGGAGRAGAGG